MSGKVALSGAVNGLKGGYVRVVEDWLGGYERSMIRLPGTIDRDELRSMLAPVVEALADGLTTIEGNERVVAYAGCAIGDVTGLRAAGAPPMLEALHRDCCHPNIAGLVGLSVVGLGRTPRREWKSVSCTAGVTIVVAVGTFAEAMSVALETSDYALTRRGQSE